MLSAILILSRNLMRREDQMIVITPPPETTRSVLTGHSLPLGEGLLLATLLLLAIAGA